MRKKTPKSKNEQFFIFNTTINNYSQILRPSRSSAASCADFKTVQTPSKGSSSSRGISSKDVTESAPFLLLKNPSPVMKTVAKKAKTRNIATMQKNNSIGTTSDLKKRTTHNKSMYCHKVDSKTSLVAEPIAEENLENSPKGSTLNKQTSALIKTSPIVKKNERKRSSLIHTAPGLSPVTRKCGPRRQGTHQANVKVVVRIRPTNKMELSLNNNGVGGIACEVVDNCTVHLLNENQTYTFDAVFDQDCTQEAVYNFVGKAMVQDVLKGYNGTIIAYGQTGSGKTYTMFGSDIFDENLAGVVPRAAAEIFHSWELSSDVKEVWVCCSMLEIYKENLRDLLTDTSADLKIKESPTQGIYVEGLCEIPIASADELLYYIDLGETRRSWAETRHNHVSSRSHSIFILEVRQVLANGSETRGILNLVDLAGSEKVGKTGAQGQLFEEGTKINLSLSALGNVIHALVSNVEHIPYRDSKLTRLLQESLGGNYKTSLIITCSPHSSQISETVTSLKFAQRAKCIRNNATVNIKKSPDQLVKMVDDLTRELRIKDNEIRKMKLQIKTGKKKNEEEDHPETVGLGLNRCKRDSFGISEFDSLEKSRDNEEPDSTLKAKVDSLIKENKELKEKLRVNELAFIEEKKRALALEAHILELEEELERLKHNETAGKSKEVTENLQIKILLNQLKALTDALEDTEAECIKLLKEKKERTEKERDELCNLELLDLLNKKKESCMLTEKWLQDLESLGLNTSPFLSIAKKFGGACEDHTKYAEALDQAVLGRAVSHETMNYLLKNQLVDSFVINNYLRRTISFLVWKLQVEKAGASLKGELRSALQSTVDSLEEILEKSSNKYHALRKRIEELDYEVEQLKKGNGGEIQTGTTLKTKIIKPIRKMSFMKLNSLGKLQAGALAVKRKFSTQSVDPVEALEDSKGISKISEEEDETDERPTKGNERIESSPTETKRLAHRSTVAGDNFRDAVIEAIGHSGNNKTRVERLEEELKNAHNELMWHKALSSLLMQEVVKTKEQESGSQKQLAEIKESSQRHIEDQNRKWQLTVDSLKATFDKELARKQKEMSAVHELLAQWIIKYMDLEKSQGCADHASLKYLLKEIVKEVPNVARIVGPSKHTPEKKK